MSKERIEVRKVFVELEIRAKEGKFDEEGIKRVKKFVNCDCGIDGMPFAISGKEDELKNEDMAETYVRKVDVSEEKEVLVFWKEE